MKITRITCATALMLFAGQLFGQGFFKKLYKRKQRNHPRIEQPTNSKCSTCKVVPDQYVQPAPFVMAVSLYSYKTQEENGPVYFIKSELRSNHELYLSVIKHENRFDYETPGVLIGSHLSTLSDFQMCLALERLTVVANSPIRVAKTENLCGILPSLDKNKSLYTVRDYNEATRSFQTPLTLVENQAGCFTDLQVEPELNKSFFKDLKNLLQEYSNQAARSIIQQDQTK